MIEYAIGATQTVLGASTVTKFTPEAYHNRWMLQKLSGGLYSFVSGPSTSVDLGFCVKNSDSIILDGPAIFYLATGGQTTTVQILISYTQGKENFESF